MQESPDDVEHIQASAACKHFVGNTMEFTTQKDGETENRGSVDSAISMRDLVDSYMVPFQACVEVGQVRQIYLCRAGVALHLPYGVPTNGVRTLCTRIYICECVCVCVCPLQVTGLMCSYNSVNGVPSW